MRKLLIAPFLLTSLFAVGCELKAHPTRMDSGFESTSQKPAQILNNTKYLSVFNIIFQPTGYELLFSNNWTLPYKTQQACIRQSNLLKSDLQAKFGSDIYIHDYSCVKVNK